MNERDDAYWDARFDAVLTAQWREDRWHAAREMLKQRALTTDGRPLSDLSPGWLRRHLILLKALALVPWAVPAHPYDSAPDRDHHCLATWGFKQAMESADWEEVGIPAGIFTRPHIYRDGS